MTASLLPSPANRIPFRTRVGNYLALWLLTAIAIQFLLAPEGITETDFSPLQQRLLWPFYTLHMVVVGLSYAVTWPSHFPAWAPWLAFGVILLLAGLLSVLRTRRTFLPLLAVQAAFLAIGVIYFIRQSYLPSGS